MHAEYHMAHLNGLRRGIDVKKLDVSHGEARNWLLNVYKETGQLSYITFGHDLLKMVCLQTKQRQVSYLVDCT